MNAHPRRRTTVLRDLRRRRPRCGSRGTFRHWLRMNERLMPIRFFRPAEPAGEGPRTAPVAT
jgi:hypothetical protein